MTVAFVPWKPLKPYLSSEGARTFACAQPEDDGTK